MASDIYPLDVPMYSQATASRLVGLSQGRVRRWLRGYEYNYTPAGAKHSQRRKQSPVVHRGKTADTQYATFLDLIEMYFVKQFVDSSYNLSLQKMRQALDEAKRLLGGHHHFAQQRFWTDGNNIYLELRDIAESMMQLLSGRQYVIAPIIKESAHHIEFNDRTKFAERWYPLGDKEPVVIDPRISFGAPTITGRRIETANIYDLYLGEGSNIKRVCSWMGLSEPEVKAAVKYEEILAAA